MDRGLPKGQAFIEGYLRGCVGEEQDGAGWKQYYIPWTCTHIHIILIQSPQIPSHSSPSVKKKTNVLFIPNSSVYMLKSKFHKTVGMTCANPANVLQSSSQVSWQSKVRLQFSVDRSILYQLLFLCEGQSIPKNANVDIIPDMSFVLLL